MSLRSNRKTGGGGQVDYANKNMELRIIYFVADCLQALRDSRR